MSFAGAALMLAGAALGLLSGVGVARLPSSLARIHAAAKPASLGLVLVVLGASVVARSLELVAIAFLVGIFQFLTAPISGHLLGRSVASLGSLDSRRSEPPEPARSPRRRRWPLVVQIAVVWVALWRDPTVPNFVAGIAIGSVVAMLIGARPSPEHFDAFGALSTYTRYLYSLVQANLRMVTQVVRLRGDDVVEAVVYCDLETRSQSVAFFDANAISFSPGTLTLEITDSPPYRMVVHALGQDAIEVTAEVSELEESAERMYG